MRVANVGHVREFFPATFVKFGLILNGIRSLVLPPRNDVVRRRRRLLVPSNLRRNYFLKWSRHPGKNLRLVPLRLRPHLQFREQAARHYQCRRFLLPFQRILRALCVTICQLWRWN